MWTYRACPPCCDEGREIIYTCCNAWTPCPDFVKVSLKEISAVFEYTCCDTDNGWDSSCTGGLSGTQVVKTYTLTLSLQNMVYEKVGDDSGPQTCFSYHMVAPGDAAQIGVVELSNTSDLLGYCYEDPAGFPPELQPCSLVHCTTSKVIPFIPMDGSDANLTVQNLSTAGMYTETDGEDCRARIQVFLEITYNTYTYHEYFPAFSQTDNCNELSGTNESFTFYILMTAYSNTWPEGTSVCPSSLTWTVDFIQIDFLNWGNGTYLFTETPDACETPGACPDGDGACFDEDEETECGATSFWPDTYRVITGDPRGVLEVDPHP